MPLLFAFFTVRVLRCSSLPQVTNIFYSFFYQLPTFTFTMTAVICLRFVLIHGIRKESGVIFFSFRFVSLLLLSHFSRVWLCDPHRRQPTRLPRPWDSPGKNTGVGCHFLLQCKKVKSQSELTQSGLTPSNPMDCSLLGSSVHGICQARVLEWDAIAFSGLNHY